MLKFSGVSFLTNNKNWVKFHKVLERPPGNFLKILLSWYRLTHKKSGYKLAYRDSAQFFLPSQKIKISKQCKQRKKVFSLKNAGWIVSKILDNFFNVNQIKSVVFIWQWSTEKNCFTQSSTTIYWSRSLAMSDILHMFIKSKKFY